MIPDFHCDLTKKGVVVNVPESPPASCTLGVRHDESIDRVVLAWSTLQRQQCFQGSQEGPRAHRGEKPREWKIRERKNFLDV